MLDDVFRVLVVVVAGAVAVRGVTTDVTDEEYALFPRLFHLDDYDTCMLKEDALFCLGEFQIQDDETNPALRLMKTYSEDFHNFNRTRLHRGYCVSERCPPPQKRANSFVQCTETNQQDQQFNNSTSHSPEHNQYQTNESINLSSLKHCNSHDKSHLHSRLTNSLRFESCVSKYARKLNLNVHLSSLQYCHTKEDVRRERKVETHQRAFLWLVGLVLLVNVVGTVSDVTRGEEKSTLLTAWSIRRNWQHLVGNFPKGDPRLATLLPTEGCRFLLLLLVIFVHSGCIHVQLYLGNPRLVEKYSHRPIMKLLNNGHSVIQIFFLLSSFLLAQSVIQGSRVPSFWILPKLLAKRVLRIAPIYLLVIGYAVTWWPVSGDGPLWGPLVEAESAACRNKFWALAFFLDNFARDGETCLVQTWYLQVEMQLYIFALLLTIVLSRVRRWALWLLGAMFIASCVANGALAYVRGWTPLMMVAGPESIRSLLENVDPFRAFYMKPWSSAGSCLAGLFVAHLLHALQERGFHPARHKKLIICCQSVLFLVPCWTGGVGHLCRDVRSRGARAVLLALERPGMSVLAAVVMFGAYNGRTSFNKIGFMQHLFSWRALYPLGRMSLAVLMVHWLVNKTFVASRRGLYYTSVLDTMVDFVATASFSYLLAVPVTVFLDIPMQQFFKALAE